MIYKILHVSMYHLTIISGVIAFVLPVLFLLLSNKLSRNVRVILISFYIIGILFVTLFTKGIHDQRMINIMPLWSYSEFSHKDILWQVYMNVFLFIPFGFLIPFSSKKTFLQTLLIGCCLSIIIEVLQYIFALGLCETDDVIHNTLGCVIGYWYWFGLSKLGEKVTKKLHRDKE